MEATGLVTIAWVLLVLASMVLIGHGIARRLAFWASGTAEMELGK
jgi:hypothetical protein